MQISSNTLYDANIKYSIKLNEEEMLVFEEDPIAKAQLQAKIEENKEESAQKKLQEQKGTQDRYELSPAEQELIDKLKSRDSEVRAHEAAHQAAGAGMTGAATYSYQQGPDGKMYAIGGEVSISTPAGSSPQESIANAKKVAAAAMAAGDPSPQDFAVAASARVMEMKAEQQLNREKQEKLLGQESYRDASKMQDNPQEEERKSTLDIPA